MSRERRWRVDRREIREGKRDERLADLEGDALQSLKPLAARRLDIRLRDRRPLMIVHLESVVVDEQLEQLLEERRLRSSK